MTARDDFAFLLRRHERRMNAERREFAEAVVDVVAHYGQGDRFDTLAYARSMQTIDALMGVWYGRWPGDRRARFWRLTLDECRAARALAFQRAVQSVSRRRLRTAPDLLRALREAA